MTGIRSIAPPVAMLAAGGIALVALVLAGGEARGESWRRFTGPRSAASLGTQT